MPAPENPSKKPPRRATFNPSALTSFLTPRGRRFDPGEPSELLICRRNRRWKAPAPVSQSSSYVGALGCFRQLSTDCVCGKSEIHGRCAQSAADNRAIDVARVWGPAAFTSGMSGLSVWSEKGRGCGLALALLAVRITRT